MKYCDLHTHSYFSDGTLSPTELVNKACEIGLKAIALCDHNTVSGIYEFKRAGEDKDIETVCGIEFSTDYKGIELHMLMLFVTDENIERVNKYVSEIQDRKEKSNIELIKALNENGYEICYDEVKSAADNGYVNRANIASVLMKKGYISSIKDGFKTILSKEYGLYKPPVHKDVFEVIRFIKSIGGVAVLAHPFLSMQESDILEFLPKAKACGLDGMETMYSKYDGETTKRAKELAVQFSLLESGGSDFHGDNKPDIKLGTGKGDLMVPYKTLESLSALT